MENVEWGEGVRAVLKPRGGKPYNVIGVRVPGGLGFCSMWISPSGSGSRYSPIDASIEWVRTPNDLRNAGWTGDWHDTGPNVWREPKSEQVGGLVGKTTIGDGSLTLTADGGGSWANAGKPSDVLRQDAKSITPSARSVPGETAEKAPWWESAEVGTLAYVKHVFLSKPMPMRLVNRLGEMRWGLVTERLSMSFGAESAEIEWAEPKVHYLAAMPQPAPVGGHGDIWADIIADTEPGALRDLYVERRQMGIDKHGVPLRYDCGRALAVDGVQELLDTMPYLKGGGLGRLLPKVEALLLEVLSEITES